MKFLSWHQWRCLLEASLEEGYNGPLSWELPLPFLLQQIPFHHSHAQRPLPLQGPTFIVIPSVWQVIGINSRNCHKCPRNIEIFIWKRTDRMSPKTHTSQGVPYCTATESDLQGKVKLLSCDRNSPPGKNQSACWMMGSITATTCTEVAAAISARDLQDRFEEHFIHSSIKVRKLKSIQTT